MTGVTVYDLQWELSRAVKMADLLDTELCLRRPVMFMKTRSRITNMWSLYIQAMRQRVVSAFHTAVV